MNCKNCGQPITFDDTIRSSKSGKKIPLNQFGMPHDCPYNKRFSQSNGQSGETIQTEPTVTTADQLLEYEKIEGAKVYINGLNQCLTEHELELVIKEKGVG